MFVRLKAILKGPDLDYEDQLEENFNKIMKGLIKDVDEAKTEGGVKGSNRIGFAELGGGVSDSEICINLF